MSVFRRLDDKLAEVPTAASCCGWCCCRARIGLRSAVLWTCALLVLEALWHITISVLRPLWEWNSTVVTVISFVLQDIARVCVLGAACLARSAVKTHTQPGTAQSSQHALVTARVGLLFKVLVGLIMLECLELTVKWAEVQTVCEAPFVKAARARRHENENITATELRAAETRCETISDIYDYVLEVITILLLVYLTWIVHSFKSTVVPATDTVVHEVGGGGTSSREVVVQGVIVEQSSVVMVEDVA